MAAAARFQSKPRSGDCASEQPHHEGAGEHGAGQPISTYDGESIFLPRERLDESWHAGKIEPIMIKPRFSI